MPLFFLHKINRNYFVIYSSSAIINFENARESAVHWVFWQTDFKTLASWPYIPLAAAIPTKLSDLFFFVFLYVFYQFWKVSNSIIIFEQYTSVIAINKLQNKHLIELKVSHSALANCIIIRVMIMSDMHIAIRE